MNTYLLAWNPLKYPWGSLDDELNQVRQDGSSWVRWSVANNRSIQPGDRLFLIRLGKDPRGIVGSGWAKTAPYEAAHWDLDRAAVGEVTNYVDMAFDSLFEAPRLPMSMLQSPPLNGYKNWSTQMSGVQIPSLLAVELEGFWAEVVGARGIGFPEETATEAEYPEGAASKVYVNKYERNPAAREACLQHYGRACCVCGMSFGDRYGSIAASFIQVHHVRQLSEIKVEYKVDPIKDLRPICPNCHAVVHLKKPALSIEQARNLLEDVKSGI
ncbi:MULTISPECIES: HNH endonuclease [Aphanothece]|uniref:HNH endonuclease n=1 Tax=Aphanothece TaxID=1121 RepID=UPI003984EECD